MSLVNLWRIRNTNRTSLAKVMTDLDLYDLSDDQVFLVKNTFEIAPFQEKSFKEWTAGFEIRYSKDDLSMMEKVWDYSIKEHKSHIHI